MQGQKESKNPKQVSVNEVRDILGLPDDTMSVYFLEALIEGKSSDALKLIDELNEKGEVETDENKDAVDGKSTLIFPFFSVNISQERTIFAYFACLAGNFLGEWL